MPANTTTLAWKTDPDFPRLALEYGYLLDELGMRADAAVRCTIMHGTPAAGMR